MTTSGPKELAEALLEEAGDALFLFDPETDQVLQVSRVAEELTGFSRRELLAMKAMALFRREQQVQVPSSLSHAATQSGVFHSIEGYLLRTRRENVWIPVNVTISRLHVRPRTLALLTARDVRERYEAHARLERVEAELRRVLASVSDAIYSCEATADGAWVCRYVSPVIEHLTGRPPSFFLGPTTNWDTIVHTDDRPALRRSAGRTLAGQPSQEEYRVVWPDGRVRWLRESVRVTRKPDGHTLRLDGVLTDITDRREAEAERDRFFTLSLDLLCIAGADGFFKRISPAFERVLGYPLTDFLSQPFMAFVHPQDRRATLGALVNLSTGAEIISFENRYRCRDGSYKWLSWTAAPFPDRQLIYAVGRDITERKQTEEALAQERNLLRALMDHLPDHIFVKDRKSRFVTANAATLQTMGAASLEAVVGKRDFDFLPPGQARQFYADEQEVLRSGKPLVNRDELVTDCTGAERWLLTTKVPLRSRSGAVIGLVGMSHDITDRKRVEAEWQRAKEAAEAASKAKSEFLAKMSHEIRTPMNGILGMTDLALDTELTREGRECLQMVKASADALLTVINDILDFSKIEAGKLHLEPAPFPLRDSLDDTVRPLGLRAQQKGLELVCHIAPDVPDRLIGDIGRLRQVLVNLVGNAIKFTEKGEVVLRVSTKDDKGTRWQGDKVSEDSGGAPSAGQRVSLSFEVRDTGIGIPDERIQAIFEPFEQVDGSVSRRYGGTGLGLAIAAQLVGLMGGKLQVASKPGQGSCFRFSVVLGLQPDAALQPIDLHHLPVLVVDDNATSREALVEILASWRMRPQGVDSGPQALQELRRAAEAGEPYTLVLLDSKMPEMDGFALAERIREQPELVGGTIMLLVSAERPESAARCRAAGISGAVLKPVKQSELLDTIQNVLYAHVRPVPQPAKAPAIEPSSPLGRPLEVLLAEDNLVNQKLAVRILEKRGHRVAVAGNGREALAAVAGRPFDVVLMDLEMPDLGGLEATALLRQGEQGTGRHLPVIALTAHAMKGDRERCLGAGMDGYVTKPLRAEELFQALNEVLTAAAPPSRKEEATMSADAVMDYDAALSHVGGDPELLRELAGVFLGEVPGMRDAVAEALQARDAGRLKRAAHTLKGSASTFGAQTVFQAARRLEEMGAGKNLGGADEAWAELRTALDRLCEALRDLDKRGTP
jgi:PAS domain S-box-containing protein